MSHLCFHVDCFLLLSVSDNSLSALRQHSHINMSIFICVFNPSLPPSLLVSLPFRILTYSYLLSFNAWLLLVPAVLCYDWQVGSIPLVESLGDLRNGATVLLALVIVTLCTRCIFSLQVKSTESCSARACLSRGAKILNICSVFIIFKAVVFNI